MERNQIEEALSALGDLLQAEGERVGVVVVGGATLSLLGLVRRSTADVDVIARAERSAGGSVRLFEADPLPESVERAIRTVARDLGLPADWMNAVVAKQWVQGLPPSLADDLTWRTYGGLDVGLVGRRTLVALKLFAAVDRGPRSVHLQDLLSLAPSDDELREAAAWVETQDASPFFPGMIEEVAVRVRRRLP